MPRWIGFLGSWALLVLALGLASVAVAGELINIRDDQRLERVAVIDKMIAERTGGKTEKLRTVAEQRSAQVQQLSRKVQQAGRSADTPDTNQVIIVSTAENKVYVRRNGQTVYEAVCSTGKGHRLAVDGRTLVFETPTGKFRVKSKEENPMWVPPDWHYVEQARKNGMRVVRLNYQNQISLSTGEPVRKQSSGVWSWFEGSGGPVLRVKNNTVVADYGDYDRELPPGEMIYAGGAVVIPPVGTPQRKFDKVLGHYRLNLGDGYALHGTQETSKLGQSVSHGCVRLGDADIEQLYQMASVGDEVVIY
ncbi:MAG TPA: L,D-transpeptidase family protein [Thermoanaerobaculia bacterium]|jgi:lipoprotein-anchoring transpeptidase ErfK/SrfK